MARQYRYTLIRRIGNWLMTAALRAGLGPARTRLLSVTGRTSGRTYATPVNLVERDGAQYLVAPYGEMSWVKNARAAGRVTLRRGRKADERRIQELAAHEAVSVLADYWRQNPITRHYFEAGPDRDMQAFEREAARHPVFSLE